MGSSCRHETKIWTRRKRADAKRIFWSERRIENPFQDIPARPSKASGPESLRGVIGLSSDVSERMGVSDRSCEGRARGTLSGWVGCQPGILMVALRARSSLLESGAGELELWLSGISVTGVSPSSRIGRFSTLVGRSTPSALLPCSPVEFGKFAGDCISDRGGPRSTAADPSSLSFSPSCSLESSTSALRSVNARQLGHWNMG